MYDQSSKMYEKECFDFLAALLRGSTTWIRSLVPGAASNRDDAADDVANIGAAEEEEGSEVSGEPDPLLLGDPALVGRRCCADPDAWEFDPEAWEMDPEAWEVDPEAWEMDPEAWEMDPEAWDVVDTEVWEIELGADLDPTEAKEVCWWYRLSYTPGEEISKFLVRTLLYKST